MDTVDRVVRSIGVSDIFKTTVTTDVLIIILLLLSLVAYVRKRQLATVDRQIVRLQPPPPVLDGPRVFPVIGSLHAMDGAGDQPFRRFTKLAHEYGPVYALRMGSMPCVIVNDYPSIKDVLITNGSKFGGRPDFIRYNVLFGGDRNNSLALCDWSKLQETRRKIARMYCSPKVCSTNYSLLNSIASNELNILLETLATITAYESQQRVQLKSLLLMSCANMFMSFMCSTKFNYNDTHFQLIVRIFDQIFWDINQGYAIDFLPWMRPLYTKHMNKLTTWSESIREFILGFIISKRCSYIKAIAMTSENEQNHIIENDEQEPADFTDALLMSLSKDSELKMNHVLFELEDFIGGHSAVGNLVMIALSLVATRPNVADTIRREANVVTNGKRLVELYDKPQMPYTEATLFETLRMISSPIVPHVATEDTTIKDFQIAKGTCIIINNFELNTSEKYWDDPEVFDPNRFIQRKPDGKLGIQKPEFFLPFGTGKRTCIGQQLVSGFGFVLLAGILQRFEVMATDQIEIPEARMALPPDTYPLILKPLKRSH